MSSFTAGLNLPVSQILPYSFTSSTGLASRTITRTVYSELLGFSF